MEELLKNLENPSADYRAIPFWSWNDKLDKENLKWQVKEMKKAGLGGYFMHARGGLQTEYMRDEWMECIGACIDEGMEQGMNSWCYDENGWPSGFADGAVTALGDKYHVRWLEIEKTTETPIIDASILGIYKLDKNLCLSNSIKATDTEEKIIIRHKSNACYVDVLNSQVISEFIKSTHEIYYAKFKEQFGKGMKGFFTDEPQFSRGKMPWSYIIPEKFKKRFNYSIIDVLPALFIECEGYKKVRYDFWSLVNELYTTSFGKQVFDWCEEHNCNLTGHAMEEDSLSAQMGATGGVMPFYEYLQIPGMDWLGRRISSPVIPKQVGSVACQLGKKFVISETFALCGWDVSWEELKWIAQWQYVNGVNLMCQHLEGYSLRGIRKRDYPPSLFYQQSWWDEYKLFNDYFARLGVLLSQGVNAIDVLLLHPIKSAWLAYNGSETDIIKKLDSDFINATELLSGLHIEHHYGDETIMKKYGSIHNNKLVVGECEYSMVVLPSMLGIDKYTVSLLNEFLKCGGKVVSLGDLPGVISGEDTDEIEEIYKNIISLNLYDNEICCKLKNIYKQHISILQNGIEINDIHIQERNFEDKKLFYMVNNSRMNTYNSECIISGSYKLDLYYPETNSVEAVEVVCEEETTKFNLGFLPMGAQVIIAQKSASLSIPKTEYVEQVFCCNENWTIEEIEHNAITLDYCSYKIDNEEWQTQIPIIELMSNLLKMQRECAIALKFEFDVNMDIEKNKEFYVAIEVAEEFEIYINENEVKYAGGWWKDLSFKTIDIKQNIKNGKNEIILERKFYQQQKVYDVLFGKDVLETETNKLTPDTELESIYLIGDFGVVSESDYQKGKKKALITKGPFKIIDKPLKLASGSFVQQGLCFYAGKLAISQKFNIDLSQGKRIILDLNKPNASIIKVFINDVEVIVIPWAPYKVDITDYVVNGDNKLSLQLFASNRNLLGPHHHIDGELYLVTPASFAKQTGWENRSRDVWTDNYCFVEFGI